MRQRLTNFGLCSRNFIFTSFTLPPKPIGILTDWDGTIIQFDEMRFVHSFNETLYRLNYPKSMMMKDLSQSKTIIDSFEKRIKSLEKSKEAYALFKEIFAESSLASEKLMPGAENFISEVTSRKLPIGIVSNLDQKLLEKQIRSLGLTSTFNTIIGSAAKPDPSALIEAAKSLNLRFGKEIWFIGDMPTDVIASNNAGFTSILVGMKKFDNIKADIKFKDLNQVTSLLKQSINHGRSR